MRNLRVIPLWKLRQQYKWRRAVNQLIKQIFKAMLLGTLMGAAVAVMVAL